MKGETFIRSITFLKLSCFFFWSCNCNVVCQFFFKPLHKVYIDGQTVRERERETERESLRYRKTERSTERQDFFFLK